MAAKNSASELERAAGNEASHPRTVTTRIVKASPRRVCSALNRLIMTGWSEVVALDAAARIMDGAERRAALREQSRRRVIFRRDLAAAVTALGGVPAKPRTARAKLAAAARRLSEVLIGPHAGDAYAACARATEAAANAYSKALTLKLPADVMFGVECQYEEVEWDRRELRRLRWGASLTPPPARTLRVQAERHEQSSAEDLQDERAIEVWSDEGGGGRAPSTTQDMSGRPGRGDPLAERAVAGCRRA